jgi:hypothetical protein
MTPRSRALARPAIWILSVLPLAAVVRPAHACDVCAVYTATELRERRVGPIVGVAEQFSHFGTLRRSGDEVDNPAGERIESSITQLLLGYTVHPRITFQVNLPVISRSFRRSADEGIDRGRERGIGDLSVLGEVEAFSAVTESGVVRLSLLGGVKFPTGDSDRLREELAEDHHHGPVDEHAADGDEHHEEPPDGEAHEHAESGVHGHDLALGSGSYDGIFGGRLFASWRRTFATAKLQYALRTRGDFEYRYADDLTWSGGPGVFLWLGHTETLGLQAILSGETKGKDDLGGEPANDTAITALYAGPGLLFTWGSSLGIEVAGDLPVMQNASALQIVPDYRVRGGASWRF